MSDNKRQFTDSEKLSIIQEASGSDREEVDAIAKKYGVTRDEILKWRKESKAFVAERKAETEILGYGHENEKVYLEANDAFIDSVYYGAVKDKINYKRLTFWTVVGVVMVVVLVTSVIGIYNYTEGSAWQQSYEASEYYELERSRVLDQTTLDSYGVVDPEAGIYRILIDEAINIIVNE